MRSRFRFAELLEDVRRAGLMVDEAHRFNVLYWIWGFARTRFRPLERLLPRVVRLELWASRRAPALAAHGWLTARKAVPVTEAPAVSARGAEGLPSRPPTFTPLVSTVWPSLSLPGGLIMLGTSPAA